MYVLRSIFGDTVQPLPCGHFPLAIIATAVCAIASPPAQALQAVWTGPVGGSWFTPGNWSNGQIPGATTAVAIQGGAPLINAGVQFASLAITGNSTVYVTNANIGMAGNISVVGAGPVSPGVTTLTGVDFYGASSMGSASINVTGAGLSVFGDAELTLNNTSTAANATLTIGGQVSLGFDEASTAAQATIINNNGGFTGFQNQASAGTSHIINNAGGLTMFLGSATADTATIVNNAGGAVDVSRMTTGVGIGSLSGAGNIYLGGTRLSLGNLAQNDEISGIIADGASPEYVAFVAQRGAIAPSPTGGSLVKVGGGTLTLTAQNTYTGEHRSMAASCGSARTQILAHPRAHSVSAAGR